MALKLLLDLPTAPSKLFRIAENTFYSDEEIKRIRRMRNIHRHKRCSLAEFMKQEFYLPATGAGGWLSEFIEREQIEDDLALQKNQIKNKKIGVQKEICFSNQLKVLEDCLAEEKFTREENMLKKKNYLDEYVAQLSSNPNSFFTRQNFEQKVEDAMARLSNYEFFIDTFGRRDVTSFDINKK